GLVGAPELGNLRSAGPHEAERIREVLTESPAAETIDDGDLVVAEAVDMVLVEIEAGVVDQELADRRLLKREDETARPPLIREVQAVAIAMVDRPIEEVEALVAEVTTGVVVDDIENHCETPHVADVDQRLELIRVRGEILTREWRPALLGEQS